MRTFEWFCCYGEIILLKLIFVSLLLISNSIFAAGFYLSEIGTPGSLGTAGVGNPVNNKGADSAWTNPAGMTGLDKSQFMSGMQILIPQVKFKSSFAGAGGVDGGNAGSIAMIPSSFYVKKVSERLRLGFSITAPLGGGLDYNDDFNNSNDDFVGRYAATKALLAGIAISPSFGYKVNDKLSIGSGVSIIWTRFDMDIAINLPAPGAPDGKVELDDATGFGYQPFVGLQYQPTDRMLIGLVYRGKADTDLKGDVLFRNFAAGQADTIKVNWDNPQTFNAGLKYKLSDDKMIAVNAGWEDWSKFSHNQISFSGGTFNPGGTIDRKFDDTWHAGIAYAQNFNKSRRVSFGFSYDSSPVSDANRTIDLPFDETFKFSTSYSVLGAGNFDYAFGASLIVFGDGKVDQIAQGVRFVGKFDSNHMLMIGATIRPKSK
jgi:long-chain fatty acid transport protein